MNGRRNIFTLVVVDVMSVDNQVATQTSMDQQRCLLRHHRPWDASSVDREVAIPPATRRRSVTDSKCSKPASKIGSSTCHGYRQPAVKLAAGLELGRAGPADQCSSTPSVKLKVACVSAEAQTDRTYVRKGRPVVNFLD